MRVMNKSVAEEEIKSFEDEEIITDNEELSEEETTVVENPQVKQLTLNKIDVANAPLWPSGIAKEWDFGKPLYRRFFHIGPITAVLIIFQIGLTTIILHSTWWPITNPGGCLNFLIFLTLNYQVLSNMMRAAFYGGGYVTFGWRPNNKEDMLKLQYCHRCNGFKAPRSHHCAKCNRCVMKMDHHCPWINNCVGHRNQVFFLRFLFFAFVGCIHSIYIVGNCLWCVVREIYYNDPYGHYDKEFQFIFTSFYLFFAAILSFSFALGVMTAVGFLFYIQIKVLFQNKTGIEDYICAKAKYRNGERGFVFPYNLGWRRNWREVLNYGKCVPKGNGVWWPVNAKCTQFSFSYEQLAQKKAKQEYYRRCREQGIVHEVTGWRRHYTRCIDLIFCRG